MPQRVDRDEPDPESDYRAVRESVHACAVWLFAVILLFGAVVIVLHWLLTSL